MSDALILYTRAHCELCETAAALAAAAGVAVDPVDIDRDVELLARYRNVIPVVRDPASGSELRWPFETAALVELDRRRASTAGTGSGG